MPYNCPEKMLFIGVLGGVFSRQYGWSIRGEIGCWNEDMRVFKTG